MSIKILFDHTIISDAIRSEDAIYYPNGYEPNKNNLIQFVRRVRPERNDWRQKEIECLRKISELCRGKTIIPYTSDELEVEEFRALKFPSRNTQSLFDGIEFNRAISPLDRTKWGLSSDQHNSKDHVISFCENFLLSPSDSRVEKFIDGMRKNPRFKLNKFEEQCLNNLSVFRSICRGIDKKHYPDALHYWTAEVNSLDVFLTVDKKFKNVMAKQNVALGCKIMFPSEVLNKFVYQKVKSQDIK